MARPKNKLYYACATVKPGKDGRDRNLAPREKQETVLCLRARGELRCACAALCGSSADSAVLLGWNPEPERLPR